MVLHQIEYVLQHYVHVKVCQDMAQTSTQDINKLVKGRKLIKKIAGNDECSPNAYCL